MEVTSHKPERLRKCLHLLNALSRSVLCHWVDDCRNEPVPNSVSWGAEISSSCNCSKVTFLLTFKILNDLHLRTSLSRESKVTSLFRLAKFSTSNDLKFLGKQFNQPPPRSSMPFSCMSSSVKFLWAKSKFKIRVPPFFSFSFSYFLMFLPQAIYFTHMIGVVQTFKTCTSYMTLLSWLSFYKCKSNYVDKPDEFAASCADVCFYLVILWLSFTRFAR